MLRIEQLEARCTPAVLATPNADADALDVPLALSADGGVLLFASKASNLVPGVADANGAADLFWRDLRAGVTKVVSARAGTAFGFAGEAVLSRDGQRVAFASAAPASLVTGDAATLDQPATNDVFWWRADTAAAKLVSVRFGQNTAVGNVNGVETGSPAISDDGGIVGFGTTFDANAIDTSVALDNGNSTFDLFRRDVMAGTTSTVSRVVGSSVVVGKSAAIDRPTGPYMSGDGRFFAYATAASAAALAGVPDRDDTRDVFVRDMATNVAASLTVASRAPNGDAAGNAAGKFAQAPTMAGGGGSVAFASNAPLVAGYTANGPSDLFVRMGGTTKLVSGAGGSGTAGASAAPGAAAFSRDGAFVAFTQGADVLLRAVNANATEAVGPGTSPALSDDGRFVAFLSTSPLDTSVNDANGVADAFVRDRTAGTTRAISTTPSGRATGNGAAASVALAAGGSQVAFVNRSTNLAAVPGSVFTSPVPVPSAGTGLSRLAASGPDDGSIRAFSFGPTGMLASANAGATPFPGTAARVAVGDVNGDGVGDIISVVGPGGGSLLRIASGSTGQDLLPATTTYETSFTGGLFVASADLDADGFAEIILSPDVGGGGRVQIFSLRGSSLQQRANFFGIDDPNFRGGARVAVGDIDGDGRPEVVVGAGFGGGPRVAVFAGATVLTPPAGSGPARLFNDFFAFPGEDSTRLRNGVYVAVGDLNGDGKGDLVFGGGPGGGPRIFALSGALVPTDVVRSYAQPLANFFAFDSAQRGGVRVAVKDLDGDAKLDLIAASGEGAAGELRTYRGATLPSTGDPALLESLAPFGGVLAGGVFVG